MVRVKSDSWDEYQFSLYWENDLSFTEWGGGYKFDLRFRDNCRDIFSAIFKKKWRVNDKEENPRMDKFLQSFAETE